MDLESALTELVVGSFQKHIYLKTRGIPKYGMGKKFTNRIYFCCTPL